eukprot:scaffold635_cov311-Pinguiococcus_pyrenoidosus.AAC.6
MKTSARKAVPAGSAHARAPLCPRKQRRDALASKTETGRGHQVSDFCSRPRSAGIRRLLFALFFSVFRPEADPAGWQVLLQTRKVGHREVAPMAGQGPANCLSPSPVGERIGNPAFLPRNDGLQGHQEPRREAQVVALPLDADAAKVRRDDVAVEGLQRRLPVDPHPNFADAWLIRMRRRGLLGNSLAELLCKVPETSQQGQIGGPERPRPRDARLGKHQQMISRLWAT